MPSERIKKLFSALLAFKEAGQLEEWLRGCSNAELKQLRKMDEVEEEDKELALQVLRDKKAGVTSPKEEEKKMEKKSKMRERVNSLEEALRGAQEAFRKTRLKVTADDVAFKVLENFRITPTEGRREYLQEEKKGVLERSLKFYNSLNEEAKEAYGDFPDQAWEEIGRKSKKLFDIGIKLLQKEGALRMEEGDEAAEEWIGNLSEEETEALMTARLKVATTATLLKVFGGRYVRPNGKRASATIATGAVVGGGTMLAGTSTSTTIGAAVGAGLMTNLLLTAMEEEAMTREMASRSRKAFSATGQATKRTALKVGSWTKRVFSRKKKEEEAEEVTQ